MHRSAEISIALMHVIRSFEDEDVQVLLDGLRDAVASTLYVERVVPDSFYKEVDKRIKVLSGTFSDPKTLKIRTVEE